MRASLAGLRSTVHLALVIDRSGSMAGPPLHEAVRRRMEEVRVAEMQECARDAARRGDWDLVMLTLDKARRRRARSGEI